MMRIEGTVEVLPKPLTREEAAKKLDPPVCVRQLCNYLNLARLYVEGFEGFSSEDGGLNRYQKIYEWHLPTLQRIREMSATQMGTEQIQIILSKRFANENY